MINKFLIPAFFIILIVSIVFLYRNYQNNKETVSNEQETVRIETYKSDLGWGYKIYKYGTLYIDQQYIPAIQGNVAFANKEDAEKIGNIVKEKVINMEVPYISIQNLDSLKVKY